MARAKANTYSFLITFFVALGSFTYGFNSAIVASVLGLESFSAYFDLSSDNPNTGAITGAMNGIYTAGGAIGCWIVSWLSDTFGRRISIQLICTLCILSAALQAGSVHIAMFLVGRLLNGMGIGMINSTVPTYQSELAPASQRGRLVGSHGFLLVSGYAVAGYSVYGVFFEPNPAIQWRLSLALQIVAPLILLAGSPFLPESPRWLIEHGRDEEAKMVLHALHTTAGGGTEDAAIEEFEEIRRQIHFEERQHLSFWGMIKQPTLRKRLILGFFLQCLTQSSGVLVVFNYQILLYSNLGLTGSIPLLLLALYNTVAATMNFVNSLIVDRVGRIRLMTIGVICCAVSLSIHCALFATYANTDNKVGNAMAIVFLFLFVFFYGGSLDATSYVYCSEIFPTQYRARGVGFAVSGLFISNIVYTQSAVVAFDNVGWKYYLVFILVPMSGLPFLIKFYPETKGLSLEEIGSIFGDQVVGHSQEPPVEYFPAQEHREKSMD